MRYLAAGVAVLLLAGSAFGGEYVVLSGVDAKDPYHGAAKLLAEHHGTRHLLHFDPQKPRAILPRLREIAPSHVALVLRPEQIHVNSVRGILRMATQVDEDPFVDFDFGYVTGRTAADAVRFVQNVVRAGKTARPQKVGSAAVWGGQGQSRAFDDTYDLGALHLPRRSLKFVQPGDAERDQGFIDEQLASLAGCGAIIMGGHGMPWEIGHGPRTEDVAKLDLFPAVAFNYACYTGVTERYPERAWQRGGSVEHVKSVEAKRSFALEMIRAGVTGYVAYVNPRPAGPELSTDFARVVAGATMGASRRTDYAKVLLGYLGFGEPGIVPPEWIEGQEHARGEVDSVRHMMLDGATGGILYGDPALQPFPVAEDALPLRVSTKRAGDALTIELRMPAEAMGTWCADPFRRFPQGTVGMARKVYARVELPDGLPEVKGVRVEEATQGGRPIATLAPVWAVEHDQGRRYLHVKVNFDYGANGAFTARLTASPRPAPPDFADPAVPLRYAVGIGEHLLAEETTKDAGKEVYDGAAGIAMFLFDLAAATKAPRWRARAESLLQRALELEDRPGLYTGVAGVGQVCLDAWWSSDDPEFLGMARRCAERIGEPEGTDVIFGAAGTGIFLLNLHAATGEERWLEEAVKLGGYLEKHALRSGGVAQWPISHEAERTYVGFSHGAAGIGYYLLQLHFATKDERFRTLAEEAARYVISQAESDGHDGWQWSKMPPPAEKDVRLQWCHGSPGIGLFFLALHQGLGGDTYAEALGKCLAANRRAGRTARASGCQCHGLSGNAELFVEAYRATGEVEHLLTARRWAADLVDEEGVKENVGGRAYGPGYMTGLAGIGRFFLRLYDPKGTRLPMMVRDPGPRGEASLLALVEKANQQALDARKDVSAMLVALKKAGPPAFEAVVALIAKGKGHWRTHLLLRATKQDGGERGLMRLADGPRLPSYGRWTALQGLGVFDTPAVRGYLLKRLERERDAGLFMSAAKALAMLKEARASDPIAKQLLAFEDGWSGVEPHLLSARVEIGGPKLIQTLEAFATDDRAVREHTTGLAVMQLSSRAPDVARRVAKQVMASKRWAAFGDAWRGRIEQVASGR